MQRGMWRTRTKCMLLTWHEYLTPGLKLFIYFNRHKLILVRNMNMHMINCQLRRNSNKCIIIIFIFLFGVIAYNYISRYCLLYVYFSNQNLIGIQINLFQLIKKKLQQLFCIYNILTHSLIND